MLCGWVQLPTEPQLRSQDTCALGGHGVGVLVVVVVVS